MILHVVFIFYIILILFLFTWTALRHQTLEDSYFVYMYPRSIDSIAKRIRILKSLHPESVKSYAQYITEYLRQYKRINHTVSNQLEKYFQVAYFDNFKDRWIAIRTAGIIIKLFIIVVLFSTHLGVAAFGYEYLDLASNTSFIGFYLARSILLSPVTLLITITEFLIFGVFFSFVSIFDKTGKFRRFSVHLDEIIRSLKPGGRDTKILLPDSDDYDGAWI
ncbi:MAG: hypothetical protein JXA77_14635 [Bacteroidales bacterium]|nr:hypothetical protein [Bacteroidales bacterium]MBN2821091.1 hypothetical protein [Bacteroidales bacterium]